MMIAVSNHASHGVAIRGVADHADERMCSRSQRGVRSESRSPRFGDVPTPQDEVALRWCTEGEQAVARTLARVTDDELAGPSALPSWTRAHVVAHLARNADALVNLLTWARTGVETPMYPSREARDAGIETTAAFPPDELRGDFRDAVARLAEAAAVLPEKAWNRPIRTM